MYLFFVAYSKKQSEKSIKSITYLRKQNIVQDVRRGPQRCRVSELQRTNTEFIQQSKTTIDIYGLFKDAYHYHRLRRMTELQLMDACVYKM